ncbi:MAG: hypothetical protein LKE18_02800 [Leuconostoc mesenteroides]|jgi:hypothetical protein|nr:hypothetical protein [Leuconostoc mesenteroides]
MMSVEMEIRTRLDVIFSKYTPNAQLTEFKEELVADLLEAYKIFPKLIGPIMKLWTMLLSN